MNSKKQHQGDANPSRVFQAFIEGCQAIPDHQKGHRHPLYARYFPEPDGHIDGRMVGDRLYEEIRTALRCNAGWTFKDIGRIKRQLIYEHFVKGADVLSAAKIISTILDAVRSERAVLPVTSESKEWQAAVQAAHDFLELNPGFMDNALTIDDRARNVGMAAKRLIDRGISVELLNGEVLLPVDVLMTAVERLRRLIRKIGPRLVVSQVFGWLSQMFDPLQERYLYVRRTSPLPQDRLPSVPIGYILNLCVSEMPASATKMDNGARVKAMTEMEELARDLIAVLDVEPYNIWEPIFTGGMEMLPFLQKVVIYDSVIPFRQMRPSDVSEFLVGVFDWVDDVEFKKSSGWTLANAHIVIKNIIKFAQGKRGPVDFQESQFDPSGQIPKSELRAILEAIAHPEKGANKEFRSPLDTTKVDFWKKPLMKRANNQYLLLDVSWCSPAFYEALATAVRELDGKADDKIGTAAERFLSEQFKRHGISTSNGKYEVNGKDGECDVVVETPGHVVFIEMKKKVLTRSAQGGNDLDILADLSHSLVAAQKQAGWHEIHLRQQKVLHLDDKGLVFDIHLNEREVERVAVSLLDYGSIQDRTMLSQFLTTIMNVQFTALDPEKDSKLKKLRGYQADLKAQHTQLVTWDAGIQKLPFFNCWFLSVPQMLVLLDDVDSLEAFQKSLWATRHVNFGTSDFYAELAARRRMAQGSDH